MENNENNDAVRFAKVPDDVTRLGPLWVKQLIHDVQARRNSASENLLLINPDGAYAAQHQMLIDVADRMLAAAQSEAIASQALRVAELAAELSNIANAKLSDFDDAESFRDWARNRARHTLAKAEVVQQAQQPAAASSPVQAVDCCDTPNYCSAARRCTAKDATPTEPAQQPGDVRESIDTPEFLGRTIAAASEAMSEGQGKEWDSFIAHISAWASRRPAAAPTRLDVMSLIHSQMHRVYASAIDGEDMDTRHMTEIEDAIMGIYHGRYIAGYDLRKSEDAIAAARPSATISDIDALQILDLFDLKVPADTKIAMVRAILAASTAPDRSAT